MDSLEFVENFERYIDEIEEVIKPELIPILNKLREFDPYDIVRPEGYFNSESHARGLVWTLFLHEKERLNT